MPLYEYRCENCGEQFEVMQKFSDAPLLTHEKCGGNVIRLLSAPALQFKGSGWYITDYAKGSSASPNNSSSSKDNGDGGKSKKSDGGGGDSKPAASESSSKPAASSSSSEKK